MVEKQHASDHVSGLAPVCQGRGARQRQSHGGVTFELLLEECLGIYQTDAGIPGKQKGLCHGKESRKSMFV